MSIELKDLTYTYMPGTPFEAKAVDSVSMKIDKGEFVGVIGHTGSGKTTMIGLMAGLLKPTSGAVLVDGQDINEKGYDRKQLRRHIGVVFQYPEHQLFEETVYKDVAFGPGKVGMTTEDIETRVRHAMTLMELDIDGMRDLSPFELSGGQKRRVAIAGVLAMDPDVLILDEPVAGLDPKGRRHLMALITRLNSEGKTIILITHSMDDLAEHAQRVIVMSGAKMVMDNTPSYVFRSGTAIREIGLDLPSVAKMARGMRQAGCSVPDDIIKLDDLEAYVAEMLAQRLKGGPL
jgi:energy-coupling factor transport system ATP-binding protein